MKMMMFRRLAPIALLPLLFASAACKKAEKGTTATTTAPTTSTAAVTTTEATATQPTSTALDVGGKMPAYEAQNLDGSKFELASRKDKVLLLNVWATWCGPCRYEIPELQRIHNAYAQRGFEVIGVSVDETGAEGVRQFVAENKMQYPVALDPDGNLANLLQTSVLPTSILVGRDGTIVWKKVGAILENDEELKSAIEKAL